MIGRPATRPISKPVMMPAIISTGDRKQIQVLDNEYSHQNLANVVADAAGSTDTYRGETFDPAAEETITSSVPSDTVEAGSPCQSKVPRGEIISACLAFQH